MSDSYFVGGYDISLITTNSVDGRLGDINKRAQVDDTDKLIKTMTLQNNHQEFDKVLKELSLHKFWKSHKSSERFHVFDFLARDRALNFYEAATFGGLNIHDTRVGIVVSILSASVPTTIKTSQLIPTANGPRPCFSRSTHVDFDIPELNTLGTHVSNAKQLLDKFFRNTQSIKRVTPTNQLQVYLNDAFRMWTVSNDKDLIEFMSGVKNRREWIPADKVSKIWTYELGIGATSLYKALPELTCFNTVWARTKSFKYNIPNKVRSFMSTY